MSGAMQGAIFGAMVPARNYFRGLARDMDVTDRIARTTRVQVEGVETRLEDLINSGDMVRLSSDRVSDFLAGLSFGRLINSVPSTAITSPIQVARVEFSESYAREAGPWPGATNAYTADGKFKEPEKAIETSALVRMGIAAGYEEVHAAVTGLCLAERPSAEAAVSLYRVFQGLSRAASRLALSQEKIEAIWTAFFGPSLSGSVGSRLLDVITADSANVGATGAEEAIGGGMLIPAGYWPVGRTITADAGFFLPSANGTDTLSLKFRLGAAAGLGGALLFSSTTALVNPGNAGDQIFAKIYLTRRADIGGVPQVEGFATIHSIGGAAGVSETLRLAQTSVAALGLGGSAISGALVLQPSVLFSAASGSNLIRQEYGTTFLQ